MSITYEAANISVSINGIVEDGLAKDSAVNFTYDNPVVSVRETIEGRGIFSVMRGGTGVLELNVEPGSGLLTVLSTLAQVQQKTGGGQFVVAVTDLNVPDGLSVFISTAARVANMPDFTYGSEAPTYTFRILCTQIEHVMAAIPSPSIL